MGVGGADGALREARVAGALVVPASGRAPETSPRGLAAPGRATDAVRATFGNTPLMNGRTLLAARPVARTTRSMLVVAMDGTATRCRPERTVCGERATRLTAPTWLVVPAKSDGRRGDTVADACGADADGVVASSDSRLRKSPWTASKNAYTGRCRTPRPLSREPVEAEVMAAMRSALTASPSPTVLCP